MLIILEERRIESMVVKLTIRYDLGLTKSRERALAETLAQIDKRTERHTKILSELVNVAYDIQENGLLTGEHLDKLKEGMSSSWELVFWIWSGRLVARMSHDFPEAGEAMLEVWGSTNAKIRTNMASLLSCYPHEHVIETIITEGLDDKAKDVRGLTAGFCPYAQNAKKYLKLLEKRLELEQDEFLKTVLQESIDYIVRGYSIEQQENGVSLLKVKEDNKIYKRKIDPSEIEQYTLEGAANMLKEKKIPWFKPDN